MTSDVRSDLRRRVLAAYAEPRTVEEAAKIVGEPVSRIGPATYALKKKKLLKEVEERGQQKVFQIATKMEAVSERTAEEIEQGTLVARLERIARELTTIAADLQVFATAQSQAAEECRRQNEVLRRTIAELKS